MKGGEIKHELEVNAPASRAWDIYGTLKLAELAAQRLPQAISKAEVLQGDGGIGTIVAITFVPGLGPIAGFKEKFTKLDNENRIKETELIEGGHLAFGFTLYRVRFHIIEKGPDSCIISSTVQYEFADEESAAAVPVTTDALAAIAAIVKDLLTAAV